VGSKQLKKNAVTSPKVKNGTLLIGDFKKAERAKLRGPAGAAGATGARGLQGLQGVQGSRGPTGVEQVVVRTTSFTFPQSNGATGQILSGDAQCQAGESVVGGGSEVSPVVSVGSQPNTIVTISRPADTAGTAPASGTVPRGWFAQARRNADTATQTVTVYVLCASAA